jgi:hypothetical protein
MYGDNAPSISTFIEREATAEQLLEFMIQRSAYQLKEADPHSWALPRLWGRPKAAMVEIQADEYGNGRPDAIHADLFARSMEAAGLDSTYGAYLDQIPSMTLATVNLMSMFGLHRRLRGAIVGHLALFEMTSSVPNRRHRQRGRRARPARALRRRRGDERRDWHRGAALVTDGARKRPPAGVRASGGAARPARSGGLLRLFD